MAQVEPRTLDEALHILDKAARENKEEIKSLLNHDYRRLSRTLSELKPQAQAVFKSVGERTRESLEAGAEAVIHTSKEAVEKVDETAHEHPWAFVGTAAAASLCVGFLLGKKWH